MHGDEAVHAYKCNDLWKTGRYVYNPHEFHGPTLYYATLPLIRLSGVEDYRETSAALFRLVPVLFGVGLILLLLLIADGLGRTAAVVAGVLTALSPAMSFYSRYYIQEILLVFFTFAVLAAGWRYVRTKRVGWALLAGACLGLMHATKETCIIALACMAAALLGTWVWQRGGRRRTRRSGATDHVVKPRPRSDYKITVLAAAALMGLVVSATLFSGLFTNWPGPLDSLRAYATYFGRGAGHELHVHPWYYYLRMLLYTHYVAGPWWSEALILALAGVGIVATLLRKGLGDASVPLLRFLSLYTVLMTFAYAVIPYKTPWCLLQFLHPMILLAGVGATVLVRWVRPRVVRVAIGVLLVVATVHLGWQANLANFRFFADHRNPYVYAHPVRGVERLTGWVEKLAAVHPHGLSMRVNVITPNAWPLPWYLRRFEQVGYYEQPPPQPDAPVIISSQDVEPALAARLRQEYHVSHYGLRPDVVLVVYAQRELYEAFVAGEEHRVGEPEKGPPE